ncbi:MAG TPA: 2-dehydropantoate 2-reductase [Thermoanaerobaculia bacterium]|nr:2-dehydropantoate 2-reductase [Thermoanaerobaculia bacterium]
MRIAIVGAGGVGGYFGGRLAQGGIDTVFIARGATLQALRSGGLRVESINGDFSVPRVNAFEDPAEAGEVDAILMAVKAWQIAEVAPRLGPMLKKETIIVPLENGMEAPDEIASALGREHAAGGMCAIVSFVVEPGHIRHMAADPSIVFGELDNQRTFRAEALLAALKSAGINAEIAENIQRSMWTKFLFIVPYSAVGAATRMPVGVWRTLPQSRALAERGLDELLAVARARGIALGSEAKARTLRYMDALPPDATSSMQRDLIEGKPSELDAQVGAVVRMARAAGVPTPTFDALYGALLPQELKAKM